MNAIQDHELAAYVLGDAPPELRSRVEAQAATDEDFRAELSALSALGMAAATEPIVTPAPPAHRTIRRRSFRRQAALAAGVLLAVGGIAWGSYELLRERPLLEDDFGKKTISNANWEPHLGRKGVSASDGYLRLLNRGSVATRREFNEPIEIELDWKWIDLAQWPLYAEIFSVCLRTNGEHKKEHAYEILDGLKIEFNAVEGRVRAVRAGVPDPSLLKAAALDSTPFTPGEWYHLRLVDDGQIVSVYLSGPSIDPKFKKEPVLTVAIPEGLTGKRIALFNREYVSGTNHESQVDNVRVRALRK